MEDNNKAYCDKEQDRRLEWLEKHYSNFNSEMGELKESQATIKTDVDWLKRNYWIIAGASIGALVTGIFNLLFK